MRPILGLALLLVASPVLGAPHFDGFQEGWTTSSGTGITVQVRLAGTEAGQCIPGFYLNNETTGCWDLIEWCCDCYFCVEEWCPCPETGVVQWLYPINEDCQFSDGDVDSFEIANCPPPGDRQSGTWRLMPDGELHRFPLATPAEPSTWGEIKAHYRRTQ